MEGSAMEQAAASAISAAAVSILRPFLGELLEKGGELASGAGNAAARSAGQAIEGIWELLFPSMKARPAALEAAKEAAAAPDDTDALEGLTAQLRRILRDDPELAAELASRVSEVESSGDRVKFGTVYAPGGVVGGVIHGGAHAAYNPERQKQVRKDNGKGQ